MATSPLDARYVQRGKNIFHAVGEGLNLLDRGALHAYDAAKAVVRPGRFDLGEGGLLPTTNAGRLLFFGGLGLPILSLATPSDATAKMYQDAQPRLNMDKEVTAGLRNAPPREKTAVDPSTWLSLFSGAGGREDAIPSSLSKQYTPPKGSTNQPWTFHDADGTASAMRAQLAGQALSGVASSVGNFAGGVASNVANRSGDTFGYRLNKVLNPSLFDRVRGDEEMASGFYKNLGAESAKALVGNLNMALHSGVSAANQRFVQAPQRKNVLNDVLQSDEILSQVKDPHQQQLLQQAYQSLQRFAPTLATDPNAVRSFLRVAVTGGGGADYASIAHLADAEATVSPPSKMKFGAFLSTINPAKLMSTEALNKIQGNGLHKLAAVKLRQDGIEVGDELTIDGAAYVLGRRLREKNATAKRILIGLDALSALSA